MRVTSREWIEQNDILGLVDVVKFHEAELKMTRAGESELAMVSEIFDLGPRIVLITRDKRGSTIYTRNEQIDIPPVIPVAEIDATGCGDVYTIGFLIDYLVSSNLKHAGIFAAACASFNVETSGPYKMPSRLDVETRMMNNPKE
jgi:sugar/nucleoside kinase (ribokinase family)